MKLQNRIYQVRYQIGFMLSIVSLLFAIQIVYGGTTIETSKTNFVGSTTAKARQQSF